MGAMKSSFLRATARAYVMSIAFWFGFAFLMGWQYGVPDRHHFWSSLVQLVEMPGTRVCA